MHYQPAVIKLEDVAEVISREFRHKETITCYLGSNAATPTACLDFLTAAIKAGEPKLPFIRMVHLLLQGPVPYVEKGLQDRILAYSIFSTGDVRKAANEGLAYYLPCTLANIDSLIAKGRDSNPISPSSRSGRTRSPASTVWACRSRPSTRRSTTPSASSESWTSACLSPRARASSTPSPSISSSTTTGSSPSTIFPPRISTISRLRKGGSASSSPSTLLSTARPCKSASAGSPTPSSASSRGGTSPDLGIQTELYGDGLMTLQKAGIVTNRKKKQHTGYSTTALIMGSKELYEYVHMRAGIQMRPCAVTNSEEVIRKNSPFIAINTAMGVDLLGNVWADFVDARRYYSGVGGQPDFVRALNDPAYGVPIITMKSITEKGESKIAMVHPPGVSLTASSYDGVVIVTEYGIADLRALTAGEKALAISSIAHPRFRDQYLKAIYDDPLFTKSTAMVSGKTHRGVTMYQGEVKLGEE